MHDSKHDVSTLRTGQFRRVNLKPKDALEGWEPVDLSVPHPQPASHFGLSEKRRSLFHESGKGVPGNSWEIPADDLGLRFELRLPYEHGFVLVLEICPSGLDGSGIELGNLLVNGNTIDLGIDPRNLNFNKQSWYVPHYSTQSGVNQISLHRNPAAKTRLFVRSAGIMRFDLKKQERGNWCWAAVTASLVNFFSPTLNLSQCEIVKTCFADQPGLNVLKDCCEHSLSKDCNQKFKIVDALDTMGVLSSRCNYALSVSELRAQINHGVPVCARIGWRGGGGHFVLITAVGPPGRTPDDNTWLRISDPVEPGASYVPYKTFRNRYKGVGSWTHSYIFERERIGKA